jgi:hypothetical protein
VARWREQPQAVMRQPSSSDFYVDGNSFVFRKGAVDLLFFFMEVLAAHGQNLHSVKRQCLVSGYFLLYSLAVMNFSGQWEQNGVLKGSSMSPFSDRNMSDILSIQKFYGGSSP